MNELETGTGRTRLTFSWRWHGRDLAVHIGGGSHHIGAVALVGRRHDETPSEQVVSLSPHKEGELALRAAKTLHEAMGVTVCVTAGIHLDAITESEIAGVLRVTEDGVQQLIRRLKEADSGGG